MSESWPELDELKRLIASGYRPSDALIDLIQQVAEHSGLAVDRLLIDHESRTICLAWEAPPTFHRTANDQAQPGPTESI